MGMGRGDNFVTYCDDCVLGLTLELYMNDLIFFNHSNGSFHCISNSKLAAALSEQNYFITKLWYLRNNVLVHFAMTGTFKSTT